MVKRGLSLEEKRRRMVELLTETRTVYTLKQLESVASKKKGITSMAVKDVADNLYYDGMVNKDKVGINTLYWQFPSELLAKKRKKLTEMQAEIEKQRATLAKLKEQEAAELVDREPTDARAAVLAEYNSLAARQSELEAKCTSFKDCDPALLAKLDSNIEVVKANTNVWTDNYFMIEAHCRNKFSIQTADLRKGFQVPDDFDYIDA